MRLSSPTLKTRRGLTLLAFVPALLFWTHLRAPGSEQTVHLENKLVKEELLLAKTPSLYFVLFTKSKVMALKSRGMILQEWKVKSVKRWGDGAPLGALTLEKKSTLFPPKRAKIRPAADEEEAGEFELEALELKDMPSRFSLFMNRGIQVYFRPQAGSFFPRLRTFGHLVAWNLWVPVKNLIFKLRRRDFGALDIKLENKEECQSAYWALFDGIQGLIFPL